MSDEVQAKSIHIVYVITQGNWGGAQRYVFDLATYFAGLKGFRVSVVCGAEYRGELTDRLAKRNIQVFTLPHLRRSLNPLTNLLFSFELKKLLQKLAPNLIHFNSTNAGIFGSYGVYLYNRGSTSSARSVYTAHGFPFNEPGLRKKLLYIPLEFSASFFREAIICVSDFDRISALKYRIAKPTKLITIHNGIDYGLVEFFEAKEARRRLGLNLPPSAVLVGTICHFYRNKGLRYLIEAAALMKIKKLQTNLYFAIFGAGPEEKLLNHLIRKAGLTDCFFMAPYVNDASKYLRAFDVITMPSLKEGLPYFLLEAGAAHRPVIASRVGGMPEIIQHNQNGLLVPPKDSAAMAQSIEKLVVDSQGRDLMGRELQKTVALDFSLEEMHQKTKDLYLDLDSRV